MAGISYFYRSISGYFDANRFKCPNCGCVKSTVVDCKYVVTQLRRCADCQLMFRVPTDDPAINAGFYENVYEQGFTTLMPSDESLAAMKLGGFAGSEKDYSYYVGILTSLGLKKGSKIFDFGCSWGYGSYQLANAGYDVMAYEVSASRARYAREKLSVRTIADMDTLEGSLFGQFDCFFSAHVIEHVPAPVRVFEYARQLLANGGLFVSFTPNGSDSHRAASKDWKKLWGEVHPHYIDCKFLNQNFKTSPRSMGSSPVINAALPKQPKLLQLNQLDGSELFFAAQKVGDAWG